MDKQQINLQADIAYLHNTTFSRQKQQEALLTDLHGFLADPKFEQYFDTLYRLRTRLLEPYSLWTPDFINMCSYICEQLRTTGTIDPLLIEIIANYDNPPAEPFRNIIAERELCVQRGDYNWCITERGQEKYVIAEQASFEDEEIKADLASLKKHHDVREISKLEQRQSHSSTHDHGTKLPIQGLEVQMGNPARQVYRTP